MPDKLPVVRLGPGGGYTRDYPKKCVADNVHRGLLETVAEDTEGREFLEHMLEVMENTGCECNNLEYHDVRSCPVLRMVRCWYCRVQEAIDPTLVGEHRLERPTAAEIRSIPNEPPKGGV